MVSLSLPALASSVSFNKSDLNFSFDLRAGAAEKTNSAFPLLARRAPRGSNCCAQADRAVRPNARQRSSTIEIDLLIVIATSESVSGNDYPLSATRDL